MANTDSPFGFRPIGHLSGGEIRARAYTASEASDTIFKGDALTMGFDGTVSLANAGDRLIGVAAEYKATLEGQTVNVYDDPNILYEVQGYTGVTFAQGHVGECGAIVATAGTNTSSGISLQELADPEGSAAFMILGKVDRPDNAWGEHVKLIVKPYDTFQTRGPVTS